MDFTLYQKVKVISGRGSAKLIGSLIQEEGYCLPLLVYEEGLRNTGIIDVVENSLTESGIFYHEYNQVKPNPTDMIVEEGARFCRQMKCDCVIAIGGGSSIDTAKGINVLRFNEGSILDYETKEVKPCSGFIAVPTTAGTGSELSQGAIVSDSKTEQKKLIPTDSFENEYAILDPLLTQKLPSNQTVFTGLDVFSHAAEAYTATKANPLCDLICEKVMETVVEYLPRAYKNGNDLFARERMLNAASLGGWSLFCSSDHLGHAIAHILGAKYHLVHGLACMYGFEAMIQYISESVEEKIVQTGVILGADFSGEESAKEIADKTIVAYQKFCQEQFQLTKEPLPYTQEELDDMANELVQNPFIHMCTKEISFEEAKKILQVALG